MTSLKLISPDSSASELQQAFADDMELRNLSSRTIHCYSNAVKHFFIFLAEKDTSCRRKTVCHPCDVTEEVLQDYRLSLLKRMKYQSAHLYMRAVKYFFAFLEKNGVIFADITVDLEPIRSEKTLPYVHNLVQVEKFINVIDTSTPTNLRNRAAVETAYSAALRRNELINIKLQDLDLTTKTLRVLGKGSKERVVPLGTMAIDWLKRYLEVREEILADRTQTDDLWISQEGVKMSGDSFARKLQEYNELADLKPPISVHGLRRACATHMLQNGADPIQLQYLLGHADLTTLSQYLRLTITDIKKMHEESKVGK